MTGGIGYCTVYRDATNLANLAFYRAKDDDDNGASVSFLDSPNTTSAITYQVYGKTNGSGTLSLNMVQGGTSDQTVGSITLLEVKG